MPSKQKANTKQATKFKDIDAHSEDSYYDEDIEMDS
jgi:hypothetical protein